MATRTICVPVAEVLEGGTKSDFYRALQHDLDLCVRMANIAMSECVKQDDWSQKKLPKLYTYPAIKDMSPPRQAYLASCIGRAAESQYRSDRWNVIHGKKSVRNFRSQPVPLLHNKSHSVLSLKDSGEFLTASVRLNGNDFIVRLAAGSSYRRQIGILKKVIPTDQYGDSKIWIDRKHKAILGIACNVPNDAQRERNGTLCVCSSRDHLVVMTQEGSDVPFVINGDRCKKWSADKMIRYQRLRQDRKANVDRRRIRRDMEAIAQKNDRRMRTLLHEVSSAVVKKANQINAEKIILDFTVRSYVRPFPWFNLITMIKYKAEQAGIAVEDGTQTIADPQINAPHVYFKFGPITNRVKIGRSGQPDTSRHRSPTDSPEELFILAIANYPQAKIVAKEKHYQAMFKQHRIDMRQKEWYDAHPVIAWLREVDWLGNAGNLSQIAQVLDLSTDKSGDGLLTANRECLLATNPGKCSHNADNTQGYAVETQPALAGGD